MKLRLLTGAATALLLTALSATAADKKPLKVFILAGQSNMVGMASASTIQAIGLDPATAPMLKDLLDKDGNPVVCDQVTICKPGPEDPENPKADPERFGKLEAGYGGGKGTRIGPEYGFGIYAHKMLGEPILIIKTARGGRDLMRMFRPPSAGPFPLSETDIATLKAQGKDVEAAKKEREESTGLQYRWMMAYIKNVLSDPKRVYPEYDASAGYELAGFAWLQGYNDFIGGNYPYVDPNAGKGSLKDYSEYTRLLSLFIKDIRKELNAPKLPFVIGVFGMDGKNPQSPNITAFRKAQAATAELPEFKGNVVNVMLEDFWPEEISEMMNELKALREAKGEVKLQGEALAAWKAYKENSDLLNANDDSKDKKKKKGAVEEDAGEEGDDQVVDADDAKLTPEQQKAKSDSKALFQQRWRAEKELRRKFCEIHFGPEKAKLLEVGMSNQSYHYWGSAKFYTLAGKAFAEALIGLQPK